ncbi:MAG: hypothetical protein HY547_04745, partial [Elusimicrobia bacterium]|nr:hypothetical protein [Elusimicrobiota bacterium]
EIRRAQMAAGSGQFSDANYGDGSLGFVKGKKPGVGDGKDGSGSGDASGANGAGGKDGKSGVGSGSAKGAMKGKLGEMAKSKFGSSGASGYNFGNTSGGASGSSKSGASSAGASSGSSGSQKGKSATSAKTGSISARSSSSKSRRGAIGDLAKRSGIAYGSGASGASYAAAGLDQAMAGKGSGVDVGGANTADSGIYESDLASSEDTASADTPTTTTEDGGSSVSCPGDWCWKTEATEDAPTAGDMETWDSMYKSASQGFMGEDTGYKAAAIGAGALAAVLIVCMALSVIPVAGWIVAAVILVVTAIVMVVADLVHHTYYTKVIIDENEDYTLSMPWNAEFTTTKSMAEVVKLQEEPGETAIPWGEEGYILYYQYEVGENKKKLAIDGEEGCAVFFDYAGYMSKKSAAEVLLPLPSGSDMYKCFSAMRQQIFCCKDYLSLYPEIPDYWYDGTDKGICRIAPPANDDEHEALKSALSSAETTSQGCIDYYKLNDLSECD